MTVKKLSFTVAMAMFSIANSYAADMSKLPIPKRAIVVDEEPIPGLYLRGDIGTTSYSSPSATYSNVTAGTVNPLTGASVARANMGGIGIGLKTGFLRVDMTFDYRSLSNYADSTPCFTTGCGANTVRNSAKVESLALMLNGYFDLGTWYSLTPYVGAGLGASMVTLRDYNSMAFSGAGVQSVTNQGSHSKQNLAFALMAGTSYAINKNVAVDFGYRYLNLGEGWTKVTAQGAAGTISEQWHMGRLGAHELRAGVRYTID